MQKHLWLVVKLGISVAILVWLFQLANAENQFDELFASEKNWAFLTLALLANVTAHIVSYYRWSIMARAIGFSLSTMEAIKIGLIGTFFNLIAFGVIGGDSFRAYYAARHSKDKIPEAISSVFADRFVGLMSIFGVAIVAFNLKDFSLLDSVEKEKLGAIQNTFRVVTICFCLGIVALVLLFLSPKLREFKAIKWAESLQFVGPLVTRVLDVVGLYQKNPGTILTCVGYSVFTNALFVTSLYFCACGLIESYPTFANHFIIVPVSLVASAVPLPGGLGLEVAITFLYQSFADQSADVAPAGFIASLGFHVTILFVSLMGCIVWVAYRKEASSIASEAEK